MRELVREFTAPTEPIGDAWDADPADRFIAATSVYLGATLITKDRKLRNSRKVRTLW